MIRNLLFFRTEKSACAVFGLSGVLFLIASSVHSDPLASNNGFYPDADEYSGVFNLANLDYPKEQRLSDWPAGGGLGDPLNQSNALAYMEALKAHIEPTMRVLVENAQEWDPVEAEWYNMVWRGAGETPVDGREVIMNTNTGQIVPSSSWSEPYRPTTPHMQNYGVIYYNHTAAYALGQVWEDLYYPNPDALRFPEGSIVVKVEAATVRPDQWPWDDPNVVPNSVLEGTSEWQVFRPPTEQQVKHKEDPTVELVNEVQTVHPFQLAIKVKDSVASPITGWVFMGFVFDARQDGSVWDKFVPAGLMWGNDPEYAHTPNGLPFGATLKETWVNPAAPPFVNDTLGWGGRMAAPMDVAVRHEVVLPDGQRYQGDDGFRVSSCISCHGTAQFPFTANLYPSPNIFFPRDGITFPMYQPGSDQWAEWFQNRKGNMPQSDYHGIDALDYDLSSMIALGIWAGVTGNDAHAFEGLNGH